MANTAGQAATRGRTKKPAETPATAPEKKERHVRSPIERATASEEKARTRLEKAKAKLADFETAKAQLAADVELAQAEFDYATMHPLLVKARREQASADVTAVMTAVDGQDEDRSPAPADTDEPVFTGDVVSTVPPSEGEDEDVDSDADAEGEASVSTPPFDFAAALGEGRDPFPPAGPQTTSV